MSTLRTVVFSQDGEIASLRRNDKNSTFHDRQGLNARFDTLVVRASCPPLVYGNLVSITSATTPELTEKMPLNQMIGVQLRQPA